METSTTDDSGYGLCKRAQALNGHCQTGPVAFDLFRMQMTLSPAVNL